MWIMKKSSCKVLQDWKRNHIIHCIENALYEDHQNNDNNAHTRKRKNTVKDQSIPE